MLICKKSVKKFIRENDKQVPKDFYVALDAKVRSILIRAIKNSKSFKRLTEADLIL